MTFWKNCFQPFSRKLSFTSLVFAWDHSFNTCAKFSERSTFFTHWCAMHVHISRGEKYSFWRKFCKREQSLNGQSLSLFHQWTNEIVHKSDMPKNSDWCNPKYFPLGSYEMRCTIWYHLYNLKNGKTPMEEC